MNPTHDSETKPAHTPGPWQVSCKGTDFTVCTKDDLVAFVAHTGQKYNDAFRALGEESANARLIAAAPDLLENLRRLVFRIDGVDGSPSIGEMEEARAAIAKATR